jgi:hypothetical protein
LIVSGEFRARRMCGWPPKLAVADRHTAPRA